MSILLYCVTEKPALIDSGPGVGGLPVLHCKQSDIHALFSQNTSAESWTGAPLKQSAREFHNVLHREFASHAIVPFRFPTLMRDEDELTSHLRDNAAEYSAQLKKFENSVQMDVSIAQPEPTFAAASSGAEYLRSRQRQSDELHAVVKHIQELAGETVQSWRDRPASHRLKLYGLVDRASVSAFHERLKKLAVPTKTSVRVSGPWPVTEFVELKQR
jgi:Gas vesicle synthesis protein GvpL/GvpF